MQGERAAVDIPATFPLESKYICSCCQDHSPKKKPPPQKQVQTFGGLWLNLICLTFFLRNYDYATPGNWNIHHQTQTLMPSTTGATKNAAATSNFLAASRGMVARSGFLLCWRGEEFRKGLRQLVIFQSLNRPKPWDEEVLLGKS